MKTSLRSALGKIVNTAAVAVLLAAALPTRAAPGDLDSLNLGLNAEGHLRVTAVQPDGKTIIAGYFTSVLGVPRRNIARLNADGTLDTGFDPNADSGVVSVAVQADGEILLGGNFTTLQPNGAGAATSRQHIARVNADGSLDIGFNPGANNAVNAIVVQTDGKVLLGGYFTTLQPNGAGAATARQGIARVNGDGTLDAGFDPNPDGAVECLAVQEDGKVLLGGTFYGLRPNGAFSPTSRQSIARVNADGTLDMGFDPNTGPGVHSVAVQADGKVLLGGSFFSLRPNGAFSSVPRQCIARVNADGTLDTGFDPKADQEVKCVAVQADGKILLGGIFNTLQPNGAAAATARRRIARVNADGTLDSFDPNVDGTVVSVAAQADGKVLLGGYFVTLRPNGAGAATLRTNFARLMNDPASQTLTVPDATQALWQRSGAGPELSSVTFESTNDGGASWIPLGTGTRVGTTANWQRTGLSLSGNGSLRALGVTSGGFGLMGQVTNFSFPLSNNADLSAMTTTAGAMTPAFSSAITTYAVTVPNGTGSITVTPATAQPNATIQVRINGGAWVSITSGSASASLALNVGANSVDVLVTAHDGAITKTYTLTATRAAPAAGDLDPLNINLGSSDIVFATAVQPDGKTIIAGSFASMLGMARGNIARLNADGTLDTGFNPGANNSVISLAVQADGKVLLGGYFTTLQPNGAAAATPRQRIARVNADGTLDTGFDPRANSGVSCIAVQADGKVLIGGNFTTLQPNGAGAAVSRQFIARVNADGTLDTGFDPRAAGNDVGCVAVQADGKVLIGGQFNSLQPNGAVAPTWRRGLARVNSDGTLDTGFDPGLDQYTYSIAVQADGKVLLGGAFSMLQPNGAGAPTVRRGIARVNADGTLDTGFDPNPTSGYTSNIAVQTNGKVLIAGQFTALQPNGAASPIPRSRIARVHGDGTLDTSFDPSPNGSVNNVTLQADGTVLLAGFFTALQPNGANVATPRNRFARLLNDPATQTLSVPDATQAVWQRGGAAPEVSRVTFDVSTDGGANWSPLGDGTRIGTTADWQFTGLLSGSGSLRVRGATTGGSGNGSSGLVGQETTYSGFPLSNNADLSALTTTAGTVSPFTPAFAASTTGYTASGLVDGTSSITVTPTKAQANATIQVRVNGGAYSSVTSGSPSSALVLNVGANPVDVLVTAHDGTTMKTYNLTVTRFAGSNNADLSALTTTAGVLTPAFSAATTAFTASLVFGTNTIIVTPTKAQANATIQVRVNGGSYASVTSGSPSSSLALNVGANPVDVLVTAQDITTTKTYTIIVTRAGPTPGDLDQLNANIAGDQFGGFFAVLATAVQPDGKTIIAGIFTSVLGVPRSNIARLNADGTLDMGFNPNANDLVRSVAVQPDGKVLLAGAFTTLRPNGAAAATARNFVARVNADGTLDTVFDPKPDQLAYSVAVQADGKVLISGYFWTLQPNGAPVPTGRRGIARVNANGTLDTGFNPNPNSFIWGIAVQTDGKVLLGGEFNTLQPNGVGAFIARQNIARVNADGTLDTGFDPRANSTVYDVTVQPDGEVLLGGSFTTLQPNGTGAAISRRGVARVNADGTLDTGFDPKVAGPEFPAVYSMAVQADGKVLLAGYFTTLQPNGAAAATSRPYVARVNADGTLDTGFAPLPNGIVDSVAVQADGKLLLGGSFTTLQPNGSGTAVPRNKFARLYNDPATQTLAAPDATQLLWQRGGAAPELSRVTFDLSTDGGTNWTPLGAGTRVGTTANWQLTGLALPTSGQIRARGVTSGGFANSSSGLIEQVAAFPVIVNTPLENWRQTHFGSTANSGDAADNFDFDGDGLDNLTEFAFGLNPVLPASAQLPQWQPDGIGFTVNFTQPAGVGGVTYGAEWSSTLLPGSWTSIPDTGTAPQHQFIVPSVGIGRMFLRLTVTAP